MIAKYLVYRKHLERFNIRISLSITGRKGGVTGGCCLPVSPVSTVSAAESPAPPLTGCSDTGGRGAEVADKGRVTAPGGRNIYTANDDQVSIVNWENFLHFYSSLRFSRFHL